MLQLLAVGAVLVVAALVAPVGLRGPLRAALAGVAVLATGALALLTPAAVPEPADVLPGDRTLADADWASSRACRACHPDAWSTWHDSYHRTMTQRASPEAILPAWEGTLTRAGRTYRLEREGDRFFVDVPAPGTTGEDPAERRRLPVVMTTGSHHMQLYWVPLPWAGEGDLPAARASFEARCAGCHGGDEGTAVAWREDRAADGLVVHDVRTVTPGSLKGQRLTPDEVRAVLDDPQHRALHEPLSDAERDDIVRYVQRLQVPGRLQQFPFAWWIREGRWVHEELTFLQPPEAEPVVEHWEQTWSDACDQCHSVGPDNRFSDDAGTVEASVAELGIACEACHGPAGRHAETYRDPLARYLERLDGDPAEHIVNPANLPPDRATALCAQCHAELVRHDEAAGSFPVGEPLDAWAHMVQRTAPPHPDWLAEVLDDDPLLLASAFWRDGTMRVAGRDANAMALSACATRGELSCLTCHDLHGGSRDDQLREGHRGDAACVGCHPAQAQAGQAHTHHPEGSPGSACMNCHMPHTTLGLLGAMRSHRIDSPDATRAFTTGRPDACTLCHVDRPLSWSAEHLADWYGHDVPPIAGEDRAAAVDGLLRGDAAQRAVWAWHLGWAPARQAAGDDWQAAILAQALDDPYAAVRSIAGQSLRRTPGYDDVAYDFTAEPEARREAAAAVLERWGERGGAAPRPEVMITPEGLDTELVRLLQTVRDDRPVVVSE